MLGEMGAQVTLIESNDDEAYAVFFTQSFLEGVTLLLSLERAMTGGAMKPGRVAVVLGAIEFDGRP